MTNAQTAAERRPVFAAMVYGLLGISALLTTATPVAIGNITIAATIPSILAAAVLAAGGLTYIGHLRPVQTVVWGAAAASVVLIVAVHALAGPGLREVQDTNRVGREIAMLQAAGKPVIHAGHYHGQFTFAGRLKQPVPVATTDEELANWCAKNPNGYVIRYWRGNSHRYTGETEIVAPFRGQIVGIVHAHAPELLDNLTRTSRRAPSRNAIGP